jgi:hypothetical protein
LKVAARRSLLLTSLDRGIGASAGDRSTTVAINNY